MITDAIKKLKNKMTSGFDMIPSFVIKDCAFVFANILQILFNMALKTNNFPRTVQGLSDFLYSSYMCQFKRKKKR